MNLIPERKITAESLNTKTKNILSVFIKTIDDLQSVVNSAKDQIVVKDEEIKAAEIERHALQNIVDKNEQMITKFTDFVN